MGGDLRVRPGPTCVDRFQSTPPYGGRRDEMEDDGAYYVVSIHAPVWGATLLRASTLIYPRVSIHAPVWGATSGGQAVKAGALFQSTPPYGGRLRETPAEW